MTDAVIVATARTAIGKAFRGAFNDTKSPTLMAHALRHAVDRAGIEPDRIDDVVIGTVLAAGTAGWNIARQSVFAAGLPLTASAQTIDRQCASGLMAIAIAAKQVIVDGMEMVVAGGQENISTVQNRYYEWANAEQIQCAACSPPFIHADARYGRADLEEVRHIPRSLGSVRASVTATNRRSTGRGPVRCRNRALYDVYVEQGQANGGGRPKRCHIGSRRGESSGHDAGIIGQARAGDRRWCITAGNASHSRTVRAPA